MLSSDWRTMTRVQSAMRTQYVLNGKYGLSKLISTSGAPPGYERSRGMVWYGMACDSDEEAIVKGQTRFLPCTYPHGTDVLRCRHSRLRAHCVCCGWQIVHEAPSLTLPAAPERRYSPDLAIWTNHKPDVEPLFFPPRSNIGQPLGQGRMSPL